MEDAPTLVYDWPAPFVDEEGRATAATMGRTFAYRVQVQERRSMKVLLRAWRTHAEASLELESRRSTNSAPASPRPPGVDRLFLERRVSPSSLRPPGGDNRHHSSKRPSSGGRRKNVAYDISDSDTRSSCSSARGELVDPLPIPIQLARETRPWDEARHRKADLLLKHIQEVGVKRGVDAVERCLFADGTTRTDVKRRQRRGGPQPPDRPAHVQGRIDLSPEEKAARDAKRLMRLHYHTSLRLILDTPNDAAMVFPHDPDLMTPQPYKAEHFLPHLPSASIAPTAGDNATRRPSRIGESRSCPVLPPLQMPASCGGGGPAVAPPGAHSRAADGGGRQAEDSAKRLYSKNKDMYANKGFITQAVRRKKVVLGLTKQVSLPVIEVKPRKELPRRWRGTVAKPTRA